MPNIGFCTAITYGSLPKSFSQAGLEFCDGYFHIKGKKAQVMPGMIKGRKQNVQLVNSKSPCIITALKIISMATIVIPLILLIGKSIFRARYEFSLLDNHKNKKISKVANSVIKLNHQLSNTDKSLHLSISSGHTTYATCSELNAHFDNIFKNLQALAEAMIAKKMLPSFESRFATNLQLRQTLADPFILPINKNNLLRWKEALDFMLEEKNYLLWMMTYQSDRYGEIIVRDLIPDWKKICRQTDEILLCIAEAFYVCDDWLTVEDLVIQMTEVSENKDSFYVRLVESYFGSGKIEEAFRIAKKITENNDSRNKIFEELAIQFVDLGSFALAFDAAKYITDAAIKDDVYKRIADKALEVDQIRHVTKAVQFLSNNGLKTKIYRKLMEKQTIKDDLYQKAAIKALESDEILNAISAASLISLNSVAENLYAQIAERAMVLDHIKDAFLAIELITHDTVSKEKLCAKLAELSLKSNDLETLLKAIGLIQNDDLIRDALYAKVAEKYLAAHELEEAKKFIGCIQKDIVSREKLYAEVIEQYLANDEFVLARKVAALIENDWKLQSETYFLIAKAVMQKSFPLDFLMEMAQLIRDSNVQEELCEILVEETLKKGQIASAREIAGLLPMGEKQNELFIKIMIQISNDIFSIKG